MSDHLPARAGLRILDVINSLDPAYGGPAEGVRQFVRASVRLGHRQEVVTLDAPGSPWLQDFPAPTHALGPRHTSYGYTRRLVPWLMEHAQAYDAVIVHGLWQYQGLGAWRALHGGNTPYFVFPHGMLDPWFRRRYPLKHLKKWLYWPWAEYRVLRDAAAVLFTTAEEERLAAQSFSLYRVRPVMLGYGLEPDDAAQHADAEDFFALHPALRGTRIVLFLGRLHPKKGCDLLIEAFARVAGRDARLQLVMAGPDRNGYRAELEALALRLGVAARITWCGMLQGDAKWGALRAAEVFALPSHQENFGIAVAEALALGLPVLLSHCVNIWREVVDSGAGLAAEDSVAGCTALLERWLALSTAEREAMRERATACFDRHFHVDAAALRLVQTIAAHQGADSQR